MEKYIAKKIHKDRESIMRFCEKHNSIYVYGAGVVGESICRYLSEEGILIKRIIVTNKGNNVDELFNIPVEEVDGVEFEVNAGVIIAVAKKYQSEVVDVLLKKNIKMENILLQKIYCTCSGKIDYSFLLNWTLSDTDLESNYFSKFNILELYGKNRATDKASDYHNYLNKYDMFLRTKMEEEVCVLEMGVLNGASLRMWKDYFSNGKIVGVDIDNDCKKYEEDRIQVIIGDLSDEDFIIDLAQMKPDVVIDDASHICSHQIKSMYHIIPKMPSGSVFIMEDLETSFNAYRDMNYYDSCISAYDFCEALSKIVCSQEIIVRENVNSSIYNLKEELENIASCIEMISFIHGSCIMVIK